MVVVVAVDMWIESFYTKLSTIFHTEKNPVFKGVLRLCNPLIQ